MILPYDANPRRMEFSERTSCCRPMFSLRMIAVSAFLAASRASSGVNVTKLFSFGSMTEKQILSFKPAPRLELVGYKHSERVQDCKHRSQ
jgi:hypothetical protein